MKYALMKLHLKHFTYEDFIIESNSDKCISILGVFNLTDKEAEYYKNALMFKNKITQLDMKDDVYYKIIPIDELDNADSLEKVINMPNKIAFMLCIKNLTDDAFYYTDWCSIQSMKDKIIKNDYLKTILEDDITKLDNISGLYYDTIPDKGSVSVSARNLILFEEIEKSIISKGSFNEFAKNVIHKARKILKEYLKAYKDSEHAPAKFFF